MTSASCSIDRPTGRLRSPLRAAETALGCSRRRISRILRPPWAPAPAPGQTARGNEAFEVERGAMSAEAGRDPERRKGSRGVAWSARAEEIRPGSSSPVSGRFRPSLLLCGERCRLWGIGILCVRAGSLANCIPPDASLLERQPYVFSGPKSHLFDPGTGKLVTAKSPQCLIAARS